MKVGNRRVLLSETLFVQDNEVAEIEHEISPGDVLKLRITFPMDYEYEGSKNPVVLYEWKEGWCEMKFANFTITIGAATNTPTIFAASSTGEFITYMALVYRLKSGHKIDIQIAAEVGI